MEEYLDAVCPHVPGVTLDTTSHLLRMPQHANELVPFLRALDIQHTRLFDLEEYMDHFEAWNVEVAQSSHPEIRIRNIVVRAMIKKKGDAATTATAAAPDGNDETEDVRAMKHRFDSVARIRHLLYPRGALTKMRKFAAVEVALAAPMCNVLSIQGSGHIECKGGSTLLATYLAVELLLEWLEVDAHEEEMTIVDDGIKNIVSTCVMPFPMSIDKMCQAYPGQCRKPRDRSFPGCKYSVQFPNGDQCCIRFFDGKHNCICVGTRTVEDTLHAHRLFYAIARAAHPHASDEDVMVI